jgi:hypothetical protein
VARSEQSSAGTSPATQLNPESSAKKGRPTPTRKEKEAARKRPLVSNDRKERRRVEREKAAAERERARIGAANGDERFYPVRDRGPQRKYIRDYVDARYSFAELMLPAMAVFFISSIFPADSLALFIGFGFMYLVLFITIAESIIVGSILKKQLTAKFGSMAPGSRFYLTMRMVYFRAWRFPKPQVKRGEFPS